MDTYQHDKNNASLGDGWRYTHSYGSNPWPTDGSSVDFYLNMPASPTGVTFTQRSGNTIKFSYQSQLKGESQQDIIFGQTSLTKEQHDAYLPNGAPVLMYHALTGIKFRNGHLNGTQTKTIITRVEITGLKDSGTCTIGSDGTVSWSNLPTTGLSTESPFYLDFSDPEYVAANGASNSDGTVSAWDSNLTGTTWAPLPNPENAEEYAQQVAAFASDHNLNESDGSLTFWFVPQEMTSDVVLKVYFKVKTPDTVDGAGEVTHTIKLGEMLNSGRTTPVKWDAGQLRTYTLKPFDVDVEIEDKMSTDGYTKTGLHVANTGNVDEYVRILIMGNWYGWRSDQNPATDEPSILVGYKYKGDETELNGLSAEQRAEKMKEMIKPWFREGYDGVDPYGSFDDDFPLAKLGDRDGKINDWADASGGFYYTMPIGPGDGIGENVASATKNLFEDYIVDPDNIPTIYLTKQGSTEREAAVGVHLVMEIVIQAIAVPTVTVGSETKNVWWLQAWYDATKVAKLAPSYSKNQKYVTLWKNGEYGSTVYISPSE